MQTTDIIAASKTEIELHSRHITVVISSINHVSKMDGINFIPLSRKSCSFSHQLVVIRIAVCSTRSYEKLREATRSYKKRDIYLEIGEIGKICLHYLEKFVG